MAKTKTTYACGSCGARTPQWRGQCPTCSEWNTLEPVTVAATPARAKRAAQAAAGPGAQRPLSLTEVDPDAAGTFGSGINALDELLGKGIVPGQAILLGGEPGIGKSTLLLQVAGHVARLGTPDEPSCVYHSGEESLGQLRGRAERLGVLDSGLAALAGTQVEDVLTLLESPNPPKLLIADSVQTLSSALVDGLPGTPSQVRAVATELIERCKKAGCALILVGHVTKDGQLAGPKLLEHMVDTVLSLEGDRKHVFRVLRVLKNRFGPTDDMVVFHMGGRGMEVVPDPSTYFLGARDPKLSGTSIVMAADGRRPFAVEVQVLVSRSYLSIPRRTGLGFDTNRLHLLLAVLEKRLRLNFGEVDIYAKIGGGLRMQDPGMDLGLAAALLSSYYDIPLPEKSAFWGEVDLNGQVRPVVGHDLRLKQATRLGYSPLFHHRNGDPTTPGPGIDTVAALQQSLFGATAHSKK